MLDYWIHNITLKQFNSCLCLCFRRSDDVSLAVIKLGTEQTTNTNTMSCAPYMWQYCWKEISAVAYIFYLVHCLLRHEITLHVLCRDKYSTSMQQYCHPGNNSYKQEPYSLGLYAHHIGGDRPNQMLNNVLLLLRTNLRLCVSHVWSIFVSFLSRRETRVLNLSHVTPQGSEI